MDEIAIKVEDLTKIYKLYDKPADRLKESLGLSRNKVLSKDHYALQHVSFDVMKGETIGIIGTNGSGKSTILKIITGVLSPTGGNLTVNGRISALLELGAGFNMEYTGIENIYLNGTMIGFTREEIEQRIDAILEFADIGEFIHQPAKTYSSGMFVRLAFAVAINIDPEILIVDEALSVGDVFFQTKCYRKFEDFKKMGKTILLVSHDLSSISKYCDRVILLNKGKKLAEGVPKQMVDMYKKVLVNQLDLDEQGKLTEVVPEKKVVLQSDLENQEEWNPSFDVNPNINEYGDKKAEIIGFNILDEKGLSSNTIEKGSTCTIQMRVKFHDRINDPIYAFTITDLKGTDITGTNSLFEKVNVQSKGPGEYQEIAFTQRMDMQGGEYMLSLGCTGYDQVDFVVHHRLYEVCNLTIVSTKNTVGFYDSNSEVALLN
ncbi:ABC transporter ATP-binding protein [uncultured Robinsoniella sp.]|uniref:ABC transporter ATP-binding protein n=1 Tax=uncultured Robinsoniella sp. TaxID=904190 RepID=UPI00374EAD44